MLIVYHSPYHGQTATTSNIVLSSIYTSLITDKKVLVTHSQYKRSNMENAFRLNEKNESILNFNDYGIDALERLARANELHEFDLKNYVHSIIPGSLDLVSGTNKSSQDLYSRLENSYMKIIDVANRAYDFVFVDANSGIQSQVTKELLEAADLVVINLNQNMKILREFFNNNSFIKDKQHLILLGNYHNESKFTAKYISSLFKTKDIFTIPHNVEFLDCYNEHLVKEFIQENMNSNKDDDNYFFISELDKLVNRILDLSGYSEEESHREYAEDDRKSIFKFF